MKNNKRMLSLRLKCLIYYRLYNLREVPKWAEERMKEVAKIKQNFETLW